MAQLWQHSPASHRMWSGFKFRRRRHVGVESLTGQKNGFAQIFSLQTCRKNVKPWSKYGGKDGKCHICIPNNRECKYLGKWGICRLCSRFTPQFFYFAAYVPEANLFKSIFPSSVLRGEVFLSPALKTNISRLHSDQEWQTKNHYVDVLPLNLYLFKYLFILHGAFPCEDWERVWTGFSVSVICP